MSRKSQNHTTDIDNNDNNTIDITNNWNQRTGTQVGTEPKTKPESAVYTHLVLYDTSLHPGTSTWYAHQYLVPGMY